MSITLYTGRNCARCTILKKFLTSRGQSFEAYDFQEDKEAFNPFYRAHRSELHRDDQNRLEIPIYDDGVVVKQGIGEVLAYLIAGDALAPCIGTTQDLHGWISGIDVSACPAGEEDHFLTVLHLLADGGLAIILDADGRRPELLERVIAEGVVAQLRLNVLGPADLYPVIAGAAVSPEDLKKSVALAAAAKESVIRIPIAPFKNAAGEMTRITPAQAGDAAKFLLDSCGDRTLPVFVEAAKHQAGLPELGDQDLLPYRSTVRYSMVKAAIRKPETHE